MKGMKKIRTQGMAVFFCLWMISAGVFAQQPTPVEERNQAVITLEKETNLKLFKAKKKAPLSYKEVWAHNVLDYDFADLTQTDLETYNALIQAQDFYRAGLKGVQERFGDPEMNQLEAKYQEERNRFYAELEKDIARNIGQTSRSRFPEEMKPENFMKTKFEEIPYFARNKGVLSAILNLQKKYQASYEETEGKAATERNQLLSARLTASKERSMEFAASAKEEEEEKEYGFMDDFWLGAKFGLNYGTGSEGGGATADGLFGIPILGTVGVSTEYIVWRIKPIAFEMSVLLDLNYIQKPVEVQGGTVNSDYFNFPVFAVGKFPAHIPLGFGDLTPFIGIGIDPYLRLSSNYVHKETGKSYVFNTKGFNIGFVWNLGGELNLLDIGTFSLEFRMSLGASSGIAAYKLMGVPKSDGTTEDIDVPEQRQNGYMVLLAYKMPLSNILFIF